MYYLHVTYCVVSWLLKWYIAYIEQWHENETEVGKGGGRGTKIAKGRLLTSLQDKCVLSLASSAFSTKPEPVTGWRLGLTLLTHNANLLIRRIGRVCLWPFNLHNYSIPLTAPSCWLKFSGWNFSRRDSALGLREHRFIKSLVFLFLTSCQVIQNKKAGRGILVKRTNVTCWNFEWILFNDWFHGSWINHVPFTTLISACRGHLQFKDITSPLVTLVWQHTYA